MDPSTQYQTYKHKCSVSNQDQSGLFKRYCWDNYLNYFGEKSWFLTLPHHSQNEFRSVLSNKTSFDEGNILYLWRSIWQPLTTCSYGALHMGPVHWKTDFLILIDWNLNSRLWMVATILNSTVLDGLNV